MNHGSANKCEDVRGSTACDVDMTRQEKPPEESPALHLMYVDESGDCGVVNSPTSHFILCGLVVHELHWEPCRQQLIRFRQRMRDQHGLKMREEIHASHMINRPGELKRIPQHDRLNILRNFADELASIQDLRVISVVVDKQRRETPAEVFERAWTILIQRFENTIHHGNFPGCTPAAGRGVLFPDHTDDKKLRGLLRRMRHFNRIPNQGGVGHRDLKLQTIVEDPCFRDSADSLFVQACDLAAYLLQQQIKPNGYMRKKSGDRYFQRLDPILCKHASRTDPQGVVRC